MNTLKPAFRDGSAIDRSRVPHTALPPNRFKDFLRDLGRKVGCADQKGSPVTIEDGKIGIDQDVNGVGL